MVTVTPDSFLNDFPEFAPPNSYPQSAIQFWLNVASVVLTARWDDTDNGSGVTMRSLGTELFAAHNLVLVKMSRDTAAKGGNPGFGTGLTSGRTVGPIAISYDNKLATDLGAGHWGLTTYGMRFLELANFMGSFPVQLGMGSSIGFLSPVPMGAAWYGPQVDQGYGW